MRDGRYRQEENNSKELERSSHRDRSRMTKTRPPHQHDDRTHGRPRSNSRSLSPCHEQSPRSINETRRDTIKRIDQEREHSRPFREVAPSSSLILRGLTANVNDGMIYQVLSKFRPLHIRVMYHKLTGLSRGFAFVDFDSVASASVVISAYASDPLILDHARVFLAYSESPSPNSTRQPNMDWLCDLCQATNFARRSECFKCQTPKSSTSVEIPSQYVPSTSGFYQGGWDPSTGEESTVETPCHVLAVRMIPLDVDENELHTVFGAFEGLQSIRLIRDRLTNASRGFCFVEFDTIPRATEVLYACQGMQMRNMTVQIGYARDTYHTRRSNAFWGTAVPNSIASAALEQAQWAFSTHHVQSQALQSSEETVAAVSEDDVNALLESAAAAARPTVETPKKPWPLPFEQAGGMYNYVTEYGLYYDPDSMCYYDPTSKLYYNQFGGKYYRYNTTTQVFDEYIPPVPVDETAVSTTLPTTNLSDRNPVNKTKAKKSKPISFGLKALTPSVTTATVFNAATAEMLEEAAVAAQAIAGPHPKVVTIGGPTHHMMKKKSALDIAKWSQVQRTGGEAPVIIETNSKAAEKEEVVVQAPICLLCRRKFSSMDQLQKHEEKSKLHAENLAKLKHNKEIVAAQYRERDIETAKEAKRQRLGTDTSNVTGVGVPVPVVETVASPAVPPSLDSGIGAKMLKMMGWRKGEGLGKHGTGITAPVVATGNGGSTTTGLGAKTAIANLDLSDISSYKERLQNMARARYDAVDDTTT